jgi:MoaA/NifB/PqqE/SkfB family radical SAM enzyme
MTATTEPSSGTIRETNLTFVWLEITGRCQLECIHCYAESGPNGTHGLMERTDWLGVIDQCADLGVQMVQFIGGEPTLHPDLTMLVEYALDQGLEVEVFTNLVRVSARMWDTFSRPGVRLACSWYSSDPKQHLLITKRNTHARTKANITKALAHGVPLRAGIIGMLDDQNVQAATTELEALGVVDVGVDHLRQVGRGIRDRDATVAELCGNCGDGVLAIGPNGAVWPCVFTRWMPVGNVQDSSLAELLAGQALAARTAELQAAFSGQPSGACNPDCNPTCAPNRCEPTCSPSCSPARCQPTCAPSCGPSCNPCSPSKGCWPSYR